MDAVTALRTAYSGAHMWFDGTVADITDTQANSVPPGVAHPIGELMAHILHSEDGMLSQFALGKQPLWATEGWGARTGAPMMLDQTPDSARSFRCDPAMLREYAVSVFAQTDAYLAGLSADDLDRDIDLSAAGMGSMTLASFLLATLLGNTLAHTGEISALKGVLGAKGYPF